MKLFTLPKLNTMLILISIISTLSIASCGQKGPLYMPESSEQNYNND